VRYRRIAQIAKVKGLNGEVVVVPTDGLPFHGTDGAPFCAEGVRVFIVPPDHNLIRETRVLRATERGDGLLLALKDVRDRTTAQRLQGRYLLAEVGEANGGTREPSPCPKVGHGDGSCVPPFASQKGRPSTPTPPDPDPALKPTPATSAASATPPPVPSPAVGLEVEDKTAGYVGTVIEERLGAAQTLWVVQGPFGAVLIPAVDAFVDSWDAHTVHMKLPVGLLELNA
jgi:ribosomal 30S subunit maturation factor RimM